MEMICLNYKFLYIKQKVLSVSGYPLGPPPDTTTRHCKLIKFIYQTLSVGGQGFMQKQGTNPDH